jgi:hypothetical protein
MLYDKIFTYKHFTLLNPCVSKPWPSVFPRLSRLFCLIPYLPKEINIYLVFQWKIMAAQICNWRLIKNARFHRQGRFIFSRNCCPKVLYEHLHRYIRTVEYSSKWSMAAPLKILMICRCTQFITMHLKLRCTINW